VLIERHAERHTELRQVIGELTRDGADNRSYATAILARVLVH